MEINVFQTVWLLKVLNYLINFQKLPMNIYSKWAPRLIWDNLRFMRTSTNLMACPEAHACSDIAESFSCLLLPQCVLSHEHSTLEKSRRCRISDRSKVVPRIFLRTDMVESLAEKRRPGEEGWRQFVGHYPKHSRKYGRNPKKKSTESPRDPTAPQKSDT
jgi:hypothetical protein